MKKTKNTVVASGKRSEPYSKSGTHNECRSETGLSLLTGGMMYSWAWSNPLCIIRMTGYNGVEFSRSGGYF